MININARLTNGDKLIKRLFRASTVIDKKTKQQLHQIGLRLKKVGRKYAKLGPTDAQMKMEAKRKRKQSKKKGTGKSGSDRGGLEKSIRFKVERGRLFLYVPDNSMAGKYAWLQHDKIKGRGPGTRRKGKQAGWKFLERAVDDNEKWILDKIKISVERLGREI